MMQRYLLLMVLGLVLSSSVFAEKRGQDLLDSLLTELPKAMADTSKVMLLGKISFAYNNINTVEGRKYAEESFGIAQKIDWKAGEAYALRALSKNCILVGDYEKAIAYSKASLKINESLGNKDAISNNLSGIASALSYQDKYAEAIEYNFKVLKIEEELGNKARAAVTLNMLATNYMYLPDYPKALDYANRALKVFEETKDTARIASSYNNIGVLYFRQQMYDSAFSYYSKSLKIAEKTGNKQQMLQGIANIATVYHSQKKYKEALPYYVKSLAMAEESGNKGALAHGIGNMGVLYYDMATDSSNNDGYRLASNMKPDYLKKSILFISKAAEMYKTLGMLRDLYEAYSNKSDAYKQIGNYKAALEAHEQYLIYKDSVFNKANTEKITRLEVESEYQRKDLADSLKNLETKKLSALKLQKQKTYTYIGAGAVLLLLGFSFFIIKNNRLLGKEKQKSEVLLLNILPAEVAMELKDRGATTAKQFDEVTVLFTDFVNFTGAGEKMGTEKLVDELHNCFKAFDAITDKYNIEKIKTIGDAYLAVCGLPLADERHAENVVRAAMEIKAFMQDRKLKMGDGTFEIRIGVHSGPVVAGIVGVRKFAYDIWGDTVNTAARMEQNSVAGKINISETTYELVKDKFNCEYRGEIDAKNKGMLRMYFVNEIS